MKITISGNPGSGKSTVSKLLASSLGLNHYSTGDFMRSIAKKRGITLLELSAIAEKDSSVDAELDEYNKKLGLEEDGFVLDSRLGFHFIPDSIKIFLVVSQEESARRILNSEKHKALEKENVDLEITTKNIMERIKSENKRYAEKYGVDYWDKSKYDLTIETDNLSPEEVVGRITSFIKSKKRFIQAK